jgi:hypothetical protein
VGSPLQAEIPFEFVPSQNPQPRLLQFAAGLTRVRYQSETSTKDFLRAPGQDKGKLKESSVEQRFESSVWEVPNGSGILRVETAPLGAGAKVGDQSVQANLANLPVSVRYQLRSGMPCTYWGEPFPARRSTALLFDQKAVKPGDSWTRHVPATEYFELPTDVEFLFLREGRVNGRLCAEVRMVATANGKLPDDKGMMTMKAEGTYLFDIRLGRVIYSDSRLFQRMIGRVPGKKSPAKRKIEEFTKIQALL